MKLSRPLVVLDIEATGLDVASDRIISIGMVAVDPDGPTCRMEEVLNPGIPIPAEATKIHGYTDEMVSRRYTFKQRATTIYAFLADADLAGFNIHNFDLPLLWEEFHRAGIDWDLSDVNVIDAGALFKKREPRTLEAAVRRYCGREHVGAHDALEDASATLDVLHGQIAAYPELLNLDAAELAKHARLDDLPRVDLAGKLVRNAEGDAVFNFGRQKGTRLRDDIGFARWILDRDFSANVKMHVNRELEAIYAAEVRA